MAFRSGPVHVFVVAPLLLCWGLERLLQTAALGIRIAATAQSVEDALQVIHTVRAHVMVVDDERQLDSAALAQVAAVLPVMLLTSERSDESMLESLAGHVAAVARKTDSPAILLQAIARACESARPRPGHYPMLAETEDAAGDADQIRISRLTAREKKLIVAMLCSETAPGKVIASRLCISEQTLRNHLSSIYGKLGVHNQQKQHTNTAKNELYRLAS